MKGLIVSQIRITGNLEKDQQLLIYGIGALIGLIVVAMITIVVIVLVRRGRAARAAAMAVPVSVPETVLPQESSFKPAESAVVEKPSVQEPEKVPVKDEKTEPEPEKVPEPVKTPEPVKAVPPKAKPSDPVALVAPDAPDTVTPPETSEKKYDFNAYKEELAGQDPTDKMEEIRRRLEEIKRQRQAGPAPVLPATEAKPPVAEPTPAKAVDEPDPVVPDEEPVTEEEMDETRPVNEVPDSEVVSIAQIPPVEQSEPVIEPEPAPEAKEEATQATPVQPEPIAETKPEAEEEVPREEIRSEGEVYYTVPDEPVMELQRDPQPQTGPVTVTPAQNGDLPNGKFLPMKKLTFAEWVELFK